MLLAGLCLAAPTPASLEHAKAADVVTSFISGTSPTLVLGLDNNLQICLALREPATMDELRARGVPVLESQRVLLLAWHLIRRLEGGRYQTVLPIIAPPSTDSLRAEGRALARRLASDCIPEMNAMLREVRNAGWERNAYALVGSFVVDGLIWQKLEQRKVIEHADASQIESGSREWSGVAWIVYPQADFKLGTNQRSFDGGRLWISWTPQAPSRLAPLDEPSQRESLVTAARSGPGTGGKLPVLTRTSPVWRAADSLATKVALEIDRAVQAGTLRRAGSALHGSSGAIILYHECSPRRCRLGRARCRCHRFSPAYRERR
jgi:hypothetical protein